MADARVQLRGLTPGFTPGLRLLAAGWCTLAFVAGAQTGSTLPANPPTSIANPNSLPAPIAAAPTGANTAQHHRARVRYADGLLEIQADNSSLNQILREVSRQTGMKIIGGVADQRVFGNYGPAPAGTVLQTLLDGTNTNMLLQETAINHVPEQLILTPRTGGVTPPGPSSPSYDITETEPDLPPPGSAVPLPVSSPTVTRSAPSTSASPSMPQPANNVLGNPNNVSPTASTLPVTNSVPVSSLPVPSTAPPVSGIVDAPNPPPAGTTTAGFTSQTPPDNNPNTEPTATSPATTPPTATQTSPNGVKTPEQIYQELQQLQKQGANPQANPQGSSAPQ